jgi:hypothetical protein
VLTAGIDDARGPEVPIALAAVVEARLAARGVRDVTVAATWEGYRVRVLLPGAAAGGETSATVAALHDALLTPMVPSTVEQAAVERRLEALAARPLPSAALAEVARCRDAPFGEAGAKPTSPGISTLEQWRAASHRLGRVVVGVAGPQVVVDSVTSAVLDEPPWPASAPSPSAGTSGTPSSPPRVYDSSGIAPGSTQITVLGRSRDAEAAVLAATLLGSAESPLRRRLGALELSAVVRDVTATAHPTGGCLALTVDLTHMRARDGDRRPDDATDPGSVASAAAIARQELGLSLAASARHPQQAVRPAALAEDPREAAELAAWWALVEAGRAPAGADRAGVTDVAVLIGVPPDATQESGARASRIAAEVERASAAWATPVVESRIAIERGQGALWLLLASPCGTLAETEADAGLTALALSAVAAGAARDAADVTPWITAEGVGLLARATRRDGESPVELAARAGDAVGAALMSPLVESSAVADARAQLMSLGADEDVRGFATLAEVLGAGHPSWVFPLLPGRGLQGASDGAVASRLAALRRGPLRVAVLGNEDAAQVEAAVQAVDRWVPRSSSGTRACGAVTGSAAAAPPRPGTYAAPPSTTSSAWLALPLLHTSQATAATAAAALDGPDGLLSRALSSGLASSWGARVVGAPDSAGPAALVVRVSSSGRTLDAAVAQVRALFDRLRRGGFTDADLTRAAARIADQELAAALSPRERLVRLWRSGAVGAAPSVAPSLDAMRAFLADAMRDEALVIVASRPPTVRSAL